MQKQWLAMAVGLTLAAGMFAATGLMTPAGADDVAIEAGWHFNDGHWNYWDADDRSWYYTDGRHWYTYGDDAWAVYKFDKKYGKKAIRQGYVVPGPGVEVVLPRHRIVVRK